jgi:two-component system nitrogen regulation sensor histidine kinase NtrY
MSSDAPELQAPVLPRLLAWAARAGVERKAALTLAVASILSGFSTYFILTRSPMVGPGPNTEVALLSLNLVLLLAFGAVVAKQLVEVWAQRRRGLAGSRLHVRLVVLFSLVAVTPTIVVAIFSYTLLSIGMESWFSDKVRTALSESRAVAQAYLEEHQQNIRTDALAMANDLDVNALRIMGNDALLDELIAKEVNVRSLTEAIIFDSVTSQILGRSALSFSLEFESPPQWALIKAQSGEAVILTSQNEDRVRALVKVDGLPNAMLYVGRPVDPLVLSHVAATNAAVDQYEKLEGQRSGYQVSFILIFGVAALLLLLAAVWVGLTFATQISRRISGLVVAAEKVRGGDLSARVTEAHENDEFGSLSRAFNRMTDQLESQQSELVEANRQLDLRRRFTEAVLSGVSAGVLGLDEQGHIHLPNRSASTLLGIDSEALLGQKLGSVVPEMAPLIDEALFSPERLIEGQIRVLTHGRAMVLRVRISAEHGQGETRGFVVTFDDITELLAAQRKAAWSDVARRIAHEMKNPLTPIQLSAERLKRKYSREITSDRETFEICTDTIIRQVGDIGRMVDEFSSFARMPAPVMKRENLQDITRQAAFLQRNAHVDIGFEMVLPADPVEISCDSRQISQALINLLQNAVDSVQGRQVAQAGAGMPSEPGRIRITLGVEDGHTVLAVEDNGKGLPKTNRESLTEPYVTTRTKGTGLGLAIVKKIMEDHAGELILEDAPSGGARVCLVFPVALVPPAARRAGTAQTDLLPAELVTNGA